ncbi:MAG: hypothetical protein ACREMD_14240 [Gemmatimonadota bacterium]
MANGGPIRIVAGGQSGDGIVSFDYGSGAEVSPVYEERWWKLALKFVALGLLYIVLGGVVVGSVAFLSVLFL